MNRKDPSQVLWLDTGSLYSARAVPTSQKLIGKMLAK